MTNDLGCGGDVDCQKALDELYAYVDGWTDGDDRGAIQAHLEACKPCVDVYDFEATLKRLIGSKCQSELPDDVRSRILAAIDGCTDEPQANA